MFRLVHGAAFFLARIACRVSVPYIIVVRCRYFVIVCDELTGMARVPMIGGRRFSLSRHLVFDTG